MAVVRPAARLRGTLGLPGDKSISHRALLLAALAEGESRILGAGDGADVRTTASLVRRLGARVEREAADGWTVDYRVVSPGVDGLVEPDGVLDCGNSGTSLRLLTGILAGLPVYAVLDGDDSLRRRPVARIIEPLRSMGAQLHARRNDSLPPLTVIGRTPLRPISWRTSVPSAQVKSAILLAGLRAAGRTTVREAVVTRDHTERMLRARGVAVIRADAGNGDAVAWSIEGGARVRPMTDRVPGDVSAAAFWLVAGAVHPDAELTLRGVGVNPTRRAVIDILRAMGARIDERPLGDQLAPQAEEGDLGGPVGEPIADVTVRSSELRGIELGPADVAAAIDEIPILCLAATQARGTTRIRGAGELRHKESDRLAGIATGLAALGASIEVEGDDIIIVGPSRLAGATTDSLDDHRLAMTFAVAGLIAGGMTIVQRPSCAAISYPGFFDDIERVRA
ncbi:MAG: 3-phosphoshikimate 1-carboxyvinyltransferase [Chloroflexota bacterium]